MKDRLQRSRFRFQGPGSRLPAPACSPRPAVSIFLALAVLTAPLQAVELPAVTDAEGRSVDLAQHFGRRRGLLVLAGLGTPAEAALLGQVQGNLERIRHEEDVALAVVLVGLDIKGAAEFCRQRTLEAPWFCDPRGELLAPLDVGFLPTLLILEPGGAVVYRTTALPEGALAKLIREPTARLGATPDPFAPKVIPERLTAP